ncbi:MAG: FAD-dependent oxidoreductase [Oscillospiraceae bacterium]|jgi:protoporphyrinogen oxidase|nr:FAD-dependent oxidoreductase [Oscillospiraceae bacterium]
MPDLQACRYLVLGAGPAGLALGVSLLRRGERSFLILEKEAEAGGLCRSAAADGYPMDVGGGHLLESGNTRACDFIFSFLPQEMWHLYTRQNGILFRGRLIDFPFEAHLSQLPEDMRARYMQSWEQAPARRGELRPNTFSDWARWQLGDAIAEDYLLPYNRKLWGVLLPRLDVDWLHKLPPDRITEEVPHFAAHNNFYYPTQHGFGEAFLRMAKALEDHIIYNCPAERIEPETRTVNDCFKAEKIINTAPWHTLDTLFPSQVRQWIAQLSYIGVSVVYHPERIPTETQAIYYPDDDVPYHRTVLRYNYNRTWPGYWTETNLTRSAEDKGTPRFVHPFAYPAPALGRQAVLQNLFAWARRQGIIPLGRWGEWAYINTDEAICRGLALAKTLLQERED